MAKSNAFVGSPLDSVVPTPDTGGDWGGVSGGYPVGEGNGGSSTLVNSPFTEAIVSPSSSLKAASGAWKDVSTVDIQGAPAIGGNASEDSAIVGASVRNSLFKAK